MRFLIFILLIQSQVILGQDLDSLRKALLKDFKETFSEKSFEIGSMTAKQDSVKNYFEIDIVPQKEGVYLIKQNIKYENGWRYKSNSILNIIKVGKKGISRTFSGIEPNPSFGFTSSVGDTIVIPIYWNNHIVENKFSSGNEREQEIYGEKRKRFNWNIKNNIDELEVVDVSSSYVIYKDVIHESVDHTIEFEAIEPGEFTLQLRNVELPVIIFPKGKSIRKYVTKIVNASYNGLPYDYSRQKIECAILRVGDKINVTFESYVQEIKNPFKPNLKLEINKQK